MDHLTTQRMDEIIQQHHHFHNSGRTLDIQFRIEQLRKLKEAIQRNEQPIMAALYQDLRKSEFEAYATEIGLTLDSIAYTIKHLKQWMKPKKVKTPFHQFPSKSFILKEPYGTILIVGPFNYPFHLVIEPLVGAIAAGNCAVLKPSENTPTVSAIIANIIKETFDESYIRVIEGERETTSILIHAPFDYIFFTGSVPVGKIVMEAAAKNLVPVTLELGGKSPVIVDRSANIELAAKRIIWGKLVNTGQTCIAPDYIFAHTEIRQELIEAMKTVIIDFYGNNAKDSSDYGRIVNERQFDRLHAILEKDSANVLYGGHSDKEDLYIEPTLLASHSSDAAMQEEIFGPILPILEYRQLEEVIQSIHNHPKPLALYLFTASKEVENEVLRRVSFGGGCINDTLSHFASSHLPFGGVGNSGIGAYHGRSSFDLFSHNKSMMKKSTTIKINVVFPPYKDKVNIIKKLLK